MFQLCENDLKACNSLINESTTQTSNSQPIVRFNSNGTLKIVQFTDLHYGQNPDSVGPEDDFNSTKVMRDLLQMENPDFVIFTGDQVTGDKMYPNVTEYIHMMLKPVVEKGYKWASVYGNHDSAPNVSRSEILAAEQSYGDLCYTKQGNARIEGVTNYYIPIYGPQKDNATTATENPVMIWWFFDSRGGRTNKSKVPAYVHDTAVEWFRYENRNLQAQWGQLPSFVFVHIPTREYKDMQQTISSNKLCSGLVDDNVTPQEQNSGFMKAVLEAGGVMAMFVGHDHGNSWCCPFKTIDICYNRHTGYGGYGEWTRGARVIVLNITDIGNHTNYVRLETGEITDVFPPKER
ncbi:putative inactive purple acid phosphatase 16 [Pseudolycoriella hygida]|uniref:Inactive purple acid phosphatase 16 n=1 Tax=Pseudolycoriella hygida TaxID=35572 RepID=A0A9Q0RVN6_9DIPT|nr:putative inactive purple acid phosphatase 16 [Pseudolycoriella hygida]